MICDACLPKVKRISGEVCIICGKPLKNGGAYCSDCQKRKHYFCKNIAVFSYEDIKESLYRFKYAGRSEYARFYAWETCQGFYDEISSWHAEAIIPVPLHRKRYQKRGYNQAEEFARELSRLFSIPVKNDLVKRRLKTRPMKLLSRFQRQNNLKKAFILGKNDVKLSTVVLVDDIYTTGTTLDCVAQICREAGIKKVYSITVAIGNGV